jgi:phage shock protein PspC (stress-responsive transcriptional regulator)
MAAMQTPTQRLRRSRQDNIFAGVAGGIGHYLQVDPVIVRIIFVLLALYGIGLLMYVIMWIAMPAELHASPASDTADQRSHTGQQAKPANWHVFVAGGGARRSQFHPMTGEPLDPEENEGNTGDEGDEEELHVKNLNPPDSQNSSTIRRSWILGAILVGLGLFFVLRAIIPGITPLFVPLLLIGAGVYIVYRYGEEENQPDEDAG